MYTAMMPASNVASNVGNDFFYKGVEYALAEYCNVNMTKGYFSPFNAYNLNSAQSANNFDMLAQKHDNDIVVIAGPVLDKDFAKHFEDTFKCAKEYGKKIFLLSVGGRAYDDNEIAHCRAVLSKYKPDIFISRDSDTYNNYNDLAAYSYNGICFAFFVSEYYKGNKIEDSNLIASCFDFAPEPDLESIYKAYSTEDSSFQLRSHGTKSLKNRVKNVLQRKFSTSIEDHLIIRACHRPMRDPRFVFNRKNILSSFISDPYLTLYSSVQLTATDRLHAAVVTIALGNKAILCLDSNRTRLLDQAGIGGCINKIYKADLNDLAEKRKSQVDFLVKSFNAVFN